MTGPSRLGPLWLPRVSVRAVLALSVVFVVSWLTVRGGETFEFQDDFQGHKPGSDGSPVWVLKGFDWTVQKGRYHATSYARDFAFPAKAPHGRRVTAETTLILDKPVSQEWKVAGLAVVRDDGNFWHLALVEGPEKEGHRHFLEVSEMLDGT